MTVGAVPHFTSRPILVLVAILLSWGAAQPGADALLSQARELAAEARTQYAGTVFNIDQPLWRQAIDTGQQALELAPNDPAPLLFLAQTYSTVHWYSRAWAAWQRYLDAGLPLAPADAPLYAEAGTELGFARYEAGDLAGALPFYQQVAGALPGNLEALRWLGRIHFELGDPGAALPYWQRLADLAPDDEGVLYYLKLSEEALRVGTEASRRFQRGLNAYDAGDLAGALTDFETALAANDTFTEAAVWAARTSLETGDLDRAERYWLRVLELDPADERAAFFLQQTRDERRWGHEAATAFYEGQQRYEAGDLAGAAERFDYAALINPDYQDARVWTARSYQELGDAARAIAAWQAVLAADPNDERARYFLRLAEQELAYGTEAGRAFSQGVEQFQGANLDTAAELFTEAVTANADFAEAWAWLGRVRFTQADYAAASVAYGAALALQPDNEDYRYFAREAALLAGDDSQPETEGP